MRVSIVVPCYNYGHLLHETLDSVLAQTYQNWECIIVDDGSTDNTKSVAEKYIKTDARFKYVYQKNKGLAGARNTGLKSCNGDYIQLLDSDDILPKTKIQKHVAVLEARKDVDLVYGNVYVFEKHLLNLDSAKQFILPKPRSPHHDDVLLALIEDNIFLVHCALFRRSAIRDVGFFYEEMITCEDWNFWFRYALLGKPFLFYDDDESRVYVRSHGINMSKNRKNMWIGNVYFRKEAVKLLANRSEPLYQRMQKRNKYLLNVVSTRLSLAYGNLFAGLVSTTKIILIYGNLYNTVYDSLYWVKERLLNRV